MQVHIIGHREKKRINFRNSGLYLYTNIIFQDMPESQNDLKVDCFVIIVITVTNDNMK